MAAYPGSEQERRIAFPELRARVAAIFEHCGMSSADAAIVADSLAVADLRGVHSHGVLRVPEYVDKLLTGGVNPAARPVVASDRTAALVVDGSNSMGQIGATFAMRRAIERARSTGVAAAAVRGSNHCGAMFYYAMMALEEDVIGIATTNSLPTMAPWGGADRIVGINPLAVAIPASEEAPVVLDAAFSYSSHGKIRVYQQKGLPIPPTWAFDAGGAPTTDPARAIEGLLQPIGEYKGVGLAVAMGSCRRCCQVQATATSWATSPTDRSPGATAICSSRCRSPPSRSRCDSRSASTRSFDGFAGAVPSRASTGYTLPAASRPKPKLNTVATEFR